MTDPIRTGRAAVAHAVRLGVEAGARGERATACPFGRHDILRTAWVRGYVRGRRTAGGAR